MLQLSKMGITQKVMAALQKVHHEPKKEDPREVSSSEEEMDTDRGEEDEELEDSMNMDHAQDGLQWESLISRGLNL